MKSRSQYLFIAFWIILFSFSAVLIFWYYRPNTSYINPKLELETWDIVENKKHNAFIDMIYWNDYFYLAYRQAESHIDVNSRLIIKRSKDEKSWEHVSELRLKNADIRDAKFLAFNDSKLFLYALKNVNFFAEPYTTYYSYSADGQHWEDLREMKTKNHVFWRPKIREGIAYAVAVQEDHRKSILLNSTDGIHWNTMTILYEGKFHGEPEISFRPDGSMVCTARMEGNAIIPLIGDDDAGTLLGVANYPYTDWKFQKEDITKLDGPALFLNKHDNNTYVIGRFEPDARGIITKTGSHFSRKRTSIFLLKEQTLIYLTDLPSCGDTSYPGLIVQDGKLYICYYTNEVHRDPFWLLGEMAPTVVKMAVIELDNLSALVNDRPSLPPQGVPLDLIFILIFSAIVVGIILKLIHPWR